MSSKSNESPSPSPKPPSLQQRATLQITAGELFKGLCSLYGPLPEEQGADRVGEVRTVAEALLKEICKMLNPEIEQKAAEAVIAQDETLFRHLETEKKLKKLGIRPDRSAICYLREHGIKKYKGKTAVEHLIRDLGWAGFDAHEYSRKHPSREGAVLSPEGQLNTGGIPLAFPPHQFVRTPIPAYSLNEPPRISTRMLDQFIEQQLKTKKAERRARVEKSRQKASEIST